MEKLRSEVDSIYKWDLTAIFKDKEEFLNTCAEIRMLKDKICKMKGFILESSDSLLSYLESSSKLSCSLEKVYVYAYLYLYEDMQNNDALELKNTVDKLNDDVSVSLSFASSELMSKGYNLIKEYIDSDDRLKKYALSLEKTFRYESHILSEKEESIIAEASKAFGTPDEVFSSLDNIDMDLGYIKDEDGKKVQLTNSNYIKYMNSKNRNVRKSAFKNMYNFFEHHINTLSNCYLGCIKENFFSSNVRKFSNPLEESLFSDKITPEFYQNFIEEIHKYLPLCYKYFKLRNKALGYKNHMYDIYVDIEKEKDRYISYDEGVCIVKNALSPLGEDYINDLSHAFTDGWIDAMPNKYKRSGAYQWGCYKVHPYVSLNYEYNVDSVSTLAHELGHAMHSFYSDKYQDYNYAQYPIFLAEIASTVNEVLVDDYLYKNAKTDEEKIVYLQNFLDKVRTTIFRQTMFAEFESIMHDKYSKDIPVTKDELCNTYLELNKLYFGKSVIVDQEIKYEWARIPHFYTPFYVYKYATGLISALKIASDILDNTDGAKASYLEFLKSGSSNYPLEILKKANVDIENPKVINKAFSLFEEKLEALEELLKKKELENE